LGVVERVFVIPKEVATALEITFSGLGELRPVKRVALFPWIVAGDAGFGGGGGRRRSEPTPKLMNCNLRDEPLRPELACSLLESKAAIKAATKRVDAKILMREDTFSIILQFQS
jgi:hypothetical protein